ncbi:MAG: TIGR03560 family F420-dependent LLM class oxidoreductase [Ktedonobacterales bacterium]
MTVRFGVFVPQGWRMDLSEITDAVEQYEAMTRVATEADALPAYDSIWVFDHFHTVPKPALETTFESWTITAGLARDTQRIHVGQMVTAAAYRNPALLAKMASTVDVMSHGRLYCGVGAGWYEHEWRAYGYGWPELRDRMRAFREAVQIMVKMWTEDFPEFAGEYHSIHGPINQPKSAGTAPPSLWIGGSGEQVTLRLVARYANACNIGGTPALIRDKLAVLRGYCEQYGRDYDTIIKSTNITVFPLRAGENAEQATALHRRATGTSFEEFKQLAIIGTPDQIAEQIQAKIAAGAEYVIVTLPRLAYDIEPLHVFASEVVPLVRQLAS